MPNPNLKGLRNITETMGKAIFNAATRRSHPRLLVVTLALTVGVFWLDLRTPAYYAVPFLYVLPLQCVIFWTAPYQFSPVIVAALLSTILNALGYFWSTDISRPDISAVNRLIAACVTWGTVILSMVRKCDEKDNIARIYETRD
jgi:FtsH-binding integral membrane protein